MAHSASQIGLVPREFREDFERERREWLRGRFLWYAGGMAAVLMVLACVIAWRVMVSAGAGDRRVTGLEQLSPFVVAGQSAMFAWFAHRARRRHDAGRAEVLAWVSRLIVVFTISSMLTAFPLARVLTELARSVTPIKGLGVGVSLMLMTGLAHLAAALLMPWTLREAVRPVVPFVLLSVLGMVWSIWHEGAEVGFALALLGMLGATIAPGLLVSWARDSRFGRAYAGRRVRERYEELSSELSLARKIHEKLFPAEISEGPLRMRFAYEPMREIGGDLLFASRVADGRGLHVVILDVTGHGIAAALAVNRLHAELRRLFARGADPAPSEVLREMNEYVALTMAGDGVYATALCARVSAREGELRWASAGHPPAILIDAAGGVRLIESTTFPLGTVDGELFEPAEESAAFHAGDRLVAYTDGAIEASDRAGRMLGVAGLERVSARAAAEATEPLERAIVAAIKAHRDGEPADDLLVAVIERTG